MALTKDKKSELVKKFGKADTDTGATEVQLALVIERINQLKDHFDTHKKDHNSRRGLLKLVGQRRRLLNYLKKTNLERYREVLKNLNIRK
ncbi:MAG: 30S ribosomal protein S15 [Spirochaetales bacterium]|nr:30S ribosomal protein S15 [Spirochaetales bacterium]